MTNETIVELVKDAHAWMDPKAELDGDPMECLDRLVAAVPELAASLSSALRERDEARAMHAAAVRVANAHADDRRAAEAEVARLAEALRACEREMQWAGAHLACMPDEYADAMHAARAALSSRLTDGSTVQGDDKPAANFDAEARLAAFAERYGTGATLRLRYVVPISTDRSWRDEAWVMTWRRCYGDAGLSDVREVFGPTLSAALAAAEEWEADNDRREPEHADHKAGNEEGSNG